MNDLEDLSANTKQKNIRLRTDFEISFAKAFAESLCEVLRTNTSMKGI